MKYGFVGISLGPGDTARMARNIEAAGYDSMVASEAKHDPFISLTIASQWTSRLELQSGVAIAFARNPMSTAILANDLQIASAGRFSLGLGSQLKTHITRRFGMPWSEPVRRMREYVMAIRAIWQSFETGDRLRFRGEFYRHSLLPPFFNPGPNPYGNPPLLLGGVGELMTEMAGEMGDGFFVHSISSRRFLEEVTIPALRRGRKRAGKSMDGFGLHFLPVVATGRDEAELNAAIKVTRQMVAFYAATPAYAPILDLHGYEGIREELHRLSAKGRTEEMASVIDDEVLNTFAIVGEPKEAAMKIQDRFGDVASSIACYDLSVTDPQHWVPVNDALRSLRGGTE